MAAWSYCVVVLFCLSNFTEARRWPDENYALPMSVYGCPDNIANDWKYGYLNITFNRTFTVYEHSREQIGRNGSELGLKELLGPYGAHSIQLNFCGRVKGQDNDVADWPIGQYGVYGTNLNQSCPSGFTSSFVNLTLPPVLFINQDGFLPYINITYNSNSSRKESVLRLRKCQRYESGEAQEFRRAELDRSTILLTHDERTFNASDSVVLNQLYIEVEPENAGRENRTRYDLFSYLTVKPQEQSLNMEDPDYLTDYTEDSTVLYAPEVRYSKGTTVRGKYLNVFLSLIYICIFNPFMYLLL